MPVIRGELLFDGGPVALGGAAVHVRLVEVSRADAAARTIAEHQVLSLPVGDAASERVPFAFESGALDSRLRYALAAHVDLDGDGRVSAGDYITMESIPVSAGDPTAWYTVRVRRVAG